MFGRYIWVDRFWVSLLVRLLLATSSIDSKTEQLLQNALRRISTNRTTIIIAHRLSTILHADKIIFLNDGKIAESGTHTELIAQKGMYYKMYSSQTS